MIEQELKKIKGCMETEVPNVGPDFELKLGEQLKAMHENLYSSKRRTNFLGFLKHSNFNYISFALGILIFFLTLVSTFFILQKNDNRLDENSLVREEIKNVAYSKFKEVTGFNYLTVQTYSNQNKITNKDALKELQKKSSNEPKIINSVYIQMEETLSPEIGNISIQWSGFDFSSYPAYRKNIPIRYDFWFSPCFTKQIVAQDKKILDYNLQTEKWNVQYSGGKYAVKTEIKDGCLFTNEIYTDVEFLLDLLNDSHNLEVRKDQTGDIVVEVDSDLKFGSIIINKIRYTASPKLLMLQKVEYIDGDNVLSKLEIKKREYNWDPRIQNIAPADELKDIEIKEQIKNYLPKEVPISKLIQKVDILYPKGSSLSQSASLSPLAPFPELVMFDLRLSEDFDPTYVEDYKNNEILENLRKENIGIPIISYYSQDTTFHVFSNEFSINDILSTNYLANIDSEQPICEPTIVRVDKNDTNAVLCKSASDGRNLAIFLKKSHGFVIGIRSSNMDESVILREFQKLTFSSLEYMGIN